MPRETATRCKQCGDGVRYDRDGYPDGPCECAMPREDVKSTHTAVAWGIEHADGNREWYDDAPSRDEAYARDERLALMYPNEDSTPVAKLRREVVTVLAITREVPDAVEAQ